MNIYDFPCSLSSPTAVALGRFDGVHTAHQKVMVGAVECKSQGLVPTVFTFCDNPNKASQGLLSTHKEKLRLVEATGIDTVVNCKFSQVCDLSPEDFVTEVLLKSLKAKKVFCGYNYRFGKGACADAAILAKLCKEVGISVQCIDEIMLEDTSVSSTAIRSLLTRGNIPKANAMLGRGYSLEGKIIHGNAIGRTIDTPTLNIDVSSEKLLPKYGVYAALVHIEDSTFKSVANIGVKPTVGSDSPTVEAYLIENSGDYYNRYASLELVDFLRAEEKFSSTEELRTQITQDIKKAKNILN